MAVWVGAVPPLALLSVADPLRQGGVRLTDKLIDKLLTAHLLYDVLKEDNKTEIKPAAGQKDFTHNAVTASSGTRTHVSVRVPSGQRSKLSVSVVLDSPALRPLTGQLCQDGSLSVTSTN